MGSSLLLLWQQFSLYCVSIKQLYIFFLLCVDIWVIFNSCQELCFYEHCFTYLLVEIQSCFSWLYTWEGIGESQVMYAQFFPWWLYRLTLPATVQQNYSFIPLPKFGYFQSLILAILLWVYQCYIVILICIFCLMMLSSFHLHIYHIDIHIFKVPV